MKPVAIIGAGITGLTAAFYLRQRGIPVIVYESSDRAGGMIHSTSRDGFLTELGPNTIMSNSPAVPRLVRDLALESRRVVPSAAAATRYIVRNGRLVCVPQSLAGAIATGLLSFSAKIRVLREPFIGRSERADESLAGFVRRRLGEEFLDYLIDPFVAGVYAGDPDQLSIAHALPKMSALERRWGSLIKGAVFGAKERRVRNAPIAWEPKMFSFDAGLGVLPETLSDRLGKAIRLKCPVTGVERGPHGWRVSSPAGSEMCESLLFCAPAHRFAALGSTSELAAELRNFEQVYYPPIARIAFGFRHSQLGRPVDGFGALVPRKERMSILGVLFSSSMFPNRAPKDHVLLTVFAGGARDPKLLRNCTDHLARLALDDLRSLLQISGTPVFTDIVKLERSIPQYNVGYGAVKDLIRRIESRSPGLFFAGNFCSGISVADCMGGGASAAERVADHWTSRAAARSFSAEMSHA